MSEKGVLGIILTFFIGLGATYAIITPVFEASDELWHYPMIRHLADGNPLPVQVFDPAQAGPWKQEASQPPLYYYLAAALTFWIDTTDMEQVLWPNPHVDNGVITADGNHNLVVHDPSRSPWQGTILAVRLIRLFSVLLGAATVYLTYRLGRVAFPDRPEIGLGAAAINAFTPMFLFISGAVNNDNLAIPLASLSLLMLIRAVRERTGPTGGRSSTAVSSLFFQPLGFPRLTYWLALGVVLGLAVLTKQGTIGLLPLTAGTIFVSLWHRRRRHRDLMHPALGSFPRALIITLLQTMAYFGLVMLPILVISGWWYVRNVQLYGDLLGWNAFIAVLGRRQHPATLAQLWDERWGFLLSYWGLFGGVNVPMWTWIYHILNALLVAAVPGFVVVGVRELRRTWATAAVNGDRRDGRAPRLETETRRLLNLVVANFPLLASSLFAAAIVVGLIRWATITWSSQGRLVFTAISALKVLLVAGWIGWLPRRVGLLFITAVSAFMFLVAAGAPWWFIRPAYKPPPPPVAEICAGDPAACAQLDDVVFDGRFSLTGYRLDRTAIQPGDRIMLTLDWEGPATPAVQDWSVFVHLNDPELGVPIAQRDMYMGQGLRPTSLLEPGQRLRDVYAIDVPATVVAPADLELAVGLYDFNTGERLHLSSGTDRAFLKRIRLQPKAGALPNPVSVNFADYFSLVGYEIEPRRAQPGATLDLVMYWQAAREVETDYTFFAQVVDAETNRWASVDLPVATSVWEVGRVQALSMPLVLHGDTPAAIYPLRIGIYARNLDGGFDNLQVVTPDGRLSDDFVNLTQIRVDR